jgi:hypothetical protein
MREVKSWKETRFGDQNPQGRRMANTFFDASQDGQNLMVEQTIGSAKAMEESR